MPSMPQELIDYLNGMIGSPEQTGEYWNPREEGYDERVATLEDDSVAGVVFDGIPTEEQVQELMRVLKPGAHLMLVGQNEEPTNHTAACRAEDVGFEVRDAILWVTGENAGERLHYVPKAPRAEREAGCQHIEKKQRDTGRKEGTVGGDNPRNRGLQPRGNSHPTVKPIGVMERLLKDVPQDTVVLDPFMGSGTTGIACLRTGHSFVGIEREEDYLAISDARIRHWDKAEKGWLSVDVQSDHDKKEKEALEVDAFDFFGDLTGGE